MSNFLTPSNLIPGYAMPMGMDRQVSASFEYDKDMNEGAGNQAPPLAGEGERPEVGPPHDEEFDGR